MQFYKLVCYNNCICFVKDNRCFYIHIDTFDTHNIDVNCIRHYVIDEYCFEDKSKFEKFNLKDLTEKEFEILFKAYQTRFNENLEVQERKVQEIQREQELPVDLI